MSMPKRQRLSHRWKTSFIRNDACSGHYQERRGQSPTLEWFQDHPIQSFGPSSTVKVCSNVKYQCTPWASNTCVQIEQRNNFGELWQCQSQALRHVHTRGTVIFVCTSPLSGSVNTTLALFWNSKFRFNCKSRTFMGVASSAGKPFLGLICSCQSHHLYAKPKQLGNPEVRCAHWAIHQQMNSTFPAESIWTMLCIAPESSWHRQWVWKASPHLEPLIPLH